MQFSCYMAHIPAGRKVEAKGSFDEAREEKNRSISWVFFLVTIYIFSKI